MQTPALVNSPTGEAQDEQEKTAQAQDERLRSVRLHALDLVEQLQALAAEQPAERQPTWIEYIGMVQDVVHFAESSGTSVIMKRAGQPLSTKQMQEFGKLLRDKRNAAGFSRVQLARKAKLSDATIKFIETARHPPSRATLIRLIGVAELKLSWSDVPGHPAPPAAERTTVVEKAEVSSELNCFITPTYDPVRMVMDLGRFLNGAGGHVEQTNAYLDHQSAAAYMAMCQQSAIAASLRASTPLADAAKRIVAASGPVGLNVIALGKPKEVVKVEPMGPEGDVKYWRDAEGVHHVPKRALEELIVSF